MKRQKTKTKERNMDLPEEVVVNIIARLPMQSICRFRLVCREWKSLTESGFFRDLYHSTSNSTSGNWSILYGDDRSLRPSLKQVKLDLPSSHGNNNPCFPFCFTPTNNEIKEIRVVASTDGLVLLRLDGEDKNMIRYYIGNPVLPQWIQLPLPRVYFLPFTDSGLVTRMHNNGTLLGYKVVQIDCQKLMFSSQTWRFEIFSSDTGEWSVTQVSCPIQPLVSFINISNPVSLNEKLHWLDRSGLFIFVYDFFSHDDQVRAISLPDKLQCGPDTCRKMICTTSQGYCVLVDAQLIEEVVNSYNVRVWRLNSDSWSWEKAWEINMASVGLGSSCVPMAINYFDIDVIYLWDSESKCFLAFNRRTLTKSYGARKATFYSDPCLCLSQFVPSLQLVPHRNPRHF